MYYMRLSERDNFLRERTLHHFITCVCVCVYFSFVFWGQIVECIEIDDSHTHRHTHAVVSRCAFPLFFFLYNYAFH